MKAVGIVAEYNPFHNGHMYNIQKAKELTDADTVIVVMSGNFVQRGDAAIISKWERARMAVLCGADAVIELPVYYSTSSAEYFAYAAIKLLNDMGCVDYIAFGAECENLEKLDTIAYLLNSEPQNYKDLFKKYLSLGLPYHKAVEKAVQDITGFSDIIKSPNNILAIQYLKALKKLKSNIKPCVIKRQGGGYLSNDINTYMPSATAIREQIFKGSLNNIDFAMPQKAYEILCESIKKGASPISTESLYTSLSYNIRNIGLNGLREIYGVGEGIENRILSAIETCQCWNDAVDYIRCGRYAYSKISRILIHSVLNITQSKLDYFNSIGFSQYIRILCVNKNRRDILGGINKNALIPVISNFAKQYSSASKDVKAMLDDEIRSSDIYSMLTPNSKLRATGRDFKESVVRPL